MVETGSGISVYFGIKIRLVPDWLLEPSAKADGNRSDGSSLLCRQLKLTAIDMAD